MICILDSYKSKYYKYRMTKKKNWTWKRIFCEEKDKTLFVKLNHEAKFEQVTRTVPDEHLMNNKPRPPAIITEEYRENFT